MRAVAERRAGLRGELVGRAGRSLFPRGLKKNCDALNIFLISEIIKWYTGAND
jgi:hypothetical protein